MTSLRTTFGCSSRRWTTSSLVLLLCCALLAGTVGYPSIRRVAKDRSTPFPCQDKPCGCADAAACWKSCCCSTNKQKVAWAKKHGVKVPDFVVAAAQQEAETKTASCCSLATKACAKPATAMPATASPAKHETSATAELELTLVLVDSQRKCQGQAPLWTLLNMTIVSDVQQPLIVRPLASGWMGIESDVFWGISAPPRLRPPRA